MVKWLVNLIVDAKFRIMDKQFSIRQQELAQQREMVDRFLKTFAEDRQQNQETIRALAEVFGEQAKTMQRWFDMFQQASDQAPVGEYIEPEWYRDQQEILQQYGHIPPEIKLALELKRLEDGGDEDQ